MEAKTTDAWRRVYGIVTRGSGRDLHVPYVHELHRDSVYSILSKEGILLYSRGKFLLSSAGKQLYKATKRGGIALTKGLPIQNKEFTTDLELIKSLDWFKYKILDKQVVSDNSCLLVGGASFLRSSKTEAPLELELKISAILKDVENGMGIPVTPIGFQRLSIFEPGVVWFRSELGLHTIQELYYDFLFTHSNKFTHDPELTWLEQDRGYLIVSTNIGEARFSCGVVAIVTECKTDSIWLKLLDADSSQFTEIKE